MAGKTDTFPLLAASTDVAWVVFRDFEDLGYILLKSLTANAVVEIQSGPTTDPAMLDSTVTTVNFTQAGVTNRVGLPVAGSRLNRASRIKVKSGQVTATITAPSQFVSFMSVQADLSGFGPLS